MTRCITAPYHTNPEHYFAQLRHLEDFVWLDSGRPHSTQGRYDIFTALATAHARVSALGEFSHTSNAAITTLDEWVAHHTAEDEQCEHSLPFTGGVIGHFGYHWQHPHFNLPTGHNYDLPLVHLRAYNWALIVDHLRGAATWVFGSNCALAEQLTPLIQSDHDLAASPLRDASQGFSCSAFKADTAPADYLQALNAISRYILAGDCYQVNFSQRFYASYTGDLTAAYLRLRRATPSPYSAFIPDAHTSILSVSPERFLKFEGAHVNTQPIKGTSPRGATTQEDQQLASALQASEKNRAENVMIVDLLRNDLSQCCKPFSVKVPRLCELHTFANVHHLISTVTGELKEGVSAFELFKRSFPGGSITGAPKKRAMEIIHELEQHDRGIYCGSIAYFSNNGNADSSISIRTVQSQGNTLYCWGGGGIVADSHADEEYQESIFKVAKLMAALSGTD
ncbi:MAG TPA: aminodeoxychorismate synthase component I [Marinagarivorans sp.]